MPKCLQCLFPMQQLLARWAPITSWITCFSTMTSNNCLIKLHLSPRSSIVLCIFFLHVEDFPMNPHVSWLVGLLFDWSVAWLVRLSLFSKWEEVKLPCSYRCTCYCLPKLRLMPLSSGRLSRLDCQAGWNPRETGLAAWTGFDSSASSGPILTNWL